MKIMTHIIKIMRESDGLSKFGNYWFASAMFSYTDLCIFLKTLEVGSIVYGYVFYSLLVVPLTMMFEIVSNFWEYLAWHLRLILYYILPLWKN